jgi:subtilisin family serine protease
LKRLLSLCLGLVLIAGLPSLPGASAAPKSTETGSPTWGSIAPGALSQFGKKETGRFIVLLRERADLSVATAIPDRDARRKAIVDELRATAERSQQEVIGLLSTAKDAGAVSSFKSFWVVNAITVEGKRPILQALAARPEVERIVADRKRHIVRTTRSQNRAAQELATTEWNIDKVGAPAAWEAGIDGSGAVVSSIDTGVDWQHPSLDEQYRGADGVHDYDWWDAIDHEVVPYDDGDHGTHTMGTMVGGDGLGPDTNDIGVAPGASWIAAKAFDSGGSGFDSWILEAAQFLTAPTRTDGSDPRPELAPDVVNNSWGGGSCEEWFDDVLTTWRAMDIFPAFAIGNSGPSEGSAGSPGDSPQAFAMGATDINDEIAWFSSRGPSCTGETKPDVSAPGDEVRSSVPGGGFDIYSGTSMATPHVAGTIALLEQASGGALGVDEAEEAMSSTALDLGTTGPDNDFGAGRLQSFDAVELVLDGGTLQGVVTDTAGAPIQGAEIKAQIEGVRTVRAISRSDGSYRMRAVEGNYQLSVSAFGYLVETGAAPVLKDQITTQNFTLTAAPRSTISGVVRDVLTSAPIAGAKVRVLGTPLAPAVANAWGNYSIEVPQGTYDLEASAGGCYGLDSASVTVGADLVQAFGLDLMNDAFGSSCHSTPFVYEPGTSKLGLTGDEESQQITLPFAFPFYGQKYGKAWLHTNGFITFDDHYDWEYHGEIPGYWEPNGALYGLWDDMVVPEAAQRGIYTSTLGAAPNRRFIIEFRNVELYSTADLVNFAMVLYENGDVEYRYRSLEGRANGQEATVGIEDWNGDSAIQYSYDESVLTDASAVRFNFGPAGRVGGAVTSAADGLPIESAVVSIGELYDYTESDGKYDVALSPDHYSAQAWAYGYGSGEAVVDVQRDLTSQVDFALDAGKVDVSPSEVNFGTSSSPVNDSITITNTGTSTLNFQALEDPLHALKIIEDPVGDAQNGAVDVIDVRGKTDGTFTRVVVDFSDDTPMDEVGGYLHLDTDQDPSTGVSPEYFYGLPEQDIGMDYYLDVFDARYGYAFLISPDFETYYWVEAAVVGHKLRVDVPLNLIEDDGAMDVTTVLGDGWGPTDWAPESGHGTISISNDVPWLSVPETSGALAPGASTVLEITADPSGLEPGDYEGAVLVRSDDPRLRVFEVPVFFSVLDTVAPTSTFVTRNDDVIVGLAGNRITGASNDSSGVQSVSITFTPLVGAATTVLAPLDCDQGRHHCTWTVTGPAIPGRYAVNARAADSKGNTENPGPSITVVSV